MANSQTNYCANESNQARLNCRVQPINCAAKYHLHLKGHVGGYNFDKDYVDYILAKHPDSEVKVIICSQGGSLTTALSVENRAKLVSVLPSREGNWRRQKFPQENITPNTYTATEVI